MSDDIGLSQRSLWQTAKPDSLDQRMGIGPRMDMPWLCAAATSFCRSASFGSEAVAPSAG